MSYQYKELAVQDDLAIIKSDLLIDNALEFSDINNNVALQVDSTGNIQTKCFDSSELKGLAFKDVDENAGAKLATSGNYIQLLNANSICLSGVEVPAGPCGPTGPQGPTGPTGPAGSGMSLVTTSSIGAVPCLPIGAANCNYTLISENGGVNWRTTNKSASTVGDTNQVNYIDPITGIRHLYIRKAVNASAASGDQGNLKYYDLGSVTNYVGSAFTAIYGVNVGASWTNNNAIPYTGEVGLSSITNLYAMRGTDTCITGTVYIEIIGI